MAVFRCSYCERLLDLSEKATTTDLYYCYECDDHIQDRIELVLANQFKARYEAREEKTTPPTAKPVRNSPHVPILEKLDSTTHKTKPKKQRKNHGR